MEKEKETKSIIYKKDIMKVICIDVSPKPKSHPGAVPLKYGHVYEVEKELLSVYGLPMYFLVGLNELTILGDRIGYRIERFIPLSSIDEQDFVREYNKQIV